MDAMTKHRIKRENCIHKNNISKRTYNNNSIKTVQCTYSSPPMSSKHTNRSLTIRTTIPTVTRDQEDTSKNFSRSHTLMTSTRKLHGYTYTTCPEGMENTTSDVNCTAYYNTEEWSYSGFQYIVVYKATNMLTYLQNKEPTWNKINSQLHSSRKRQ